MSTAVVFPYKGLSPLRIIEKKKIKKSNNYGKSFLKVFTNMSLPLGITAKSG